MKWGLEICDVNFPVAKVRGVSVAVFLIRWFPVDEEDDAELVRRCALASRF